MNETAATIQPSDSPAAREPEFAMSGSALGFMVLSWLIIIACTGHCFRKLLTSQRRLDDDASPSADAAEPERSGSHPDVD